MRIWKPKMENDFWFSFMDTHVRHLKQLPCWIVSPTSHTASYVKVCRILPFQRTNPKYRPTLLPQYRNQDCDFPRQTAAPRFWSPKETTKNSNLNGFFFIAHEHPDCSIEKIPAFKDPSSTARDMPSNTTSFDPTQLKHTLETKNIKNLFFAGQVNGNNRL